MPIISARALLLNSLLSNFFFKIFQFPGENINTIFLFLPICVHLCLWFGRLTTSLWLINYFTANKPLTLRASAPPREPKSLTLNQRLYYPSHLLICQIGMHWQTHNPFRSLLSYRERSRTLPEICKNRLQVKKYGIMNSCWYTCGI